MSQIVSNDFYLFTFLPGPVDLHLRPEIYQNTRKIADFHKNVRPKANDWYLNGF